MPQQGRRKLHVVCPQCNAVNRLPSARLGDRGSCGSCKQPLYQGKSVELTAANFETQVGRSDVPVVVDFWAPWCGPCRVMAPQFEKAAPMLEPGFRLAKLNTEQGQGLAARFGIRPIPTLAIFHQGHELARQSGALDAAALARWARESVQAG